MLLSLSTWQEVERRTASDRGIIVPVGSTEQHGPNGVLGTDAICAEAVGRAAADRADLLVAPTIAYTPAQFNMGFAGSVSIRATTLMAIVQDVVRSLVGHGLVHVYFLNGHGANIAPLRAAFHDLHADLDDSGLRLRLRSWWEFPAVDALRQSLFGVREGIHATPSEVAITQAVAAANVRPAPEFEHQALSPEQLRDLAGDNHPGASAHRRAFPDGRVGSDPAMASPALGRRLLACAADGLVDDYRRFAADPGASR